jgi:hypothetical protein
MADKEAICLMVFGHIRPIRLTRERRRVSRSKLAASNSQATCIGQHLIENFAIAHASKSAGAGKKVFVWDSAQNYGKMQSPAFKRLLLRNSFETNDSVSIGMLRIGYCWLQNCMEGVPLIT